MHRDDAPTSVEVTASPGAASAVSSFIGPYRILQVLGEGGMGIVYLAEQSTPIVRRVALKILKLGMDTKQFVARFEAERQALAVMDHPGIARVHDAGATDAGRPYFVMELVHGVPITGYCDANRLSTNDRVTLMTGVCQAVQHAHQKGVIHRDLKPSNVLVAMLDGRPVTKIIDFGVAKAIDHRLTNLTLYTEIGQRIGTPAYMSPEQMEMSQLDIDTRTDIYSLGVMLYELLTGTLPFSDDLLRRAITQPQLLRDTDLPTPSARVTSLGNDLPGIASRRHTDPASLGRTIAGDLDWITLKAMAMDRTRRYETANDFALDLQRYLAFEPVTARPPSTHDRVAKFVRRHRLGVTVAAVIALMVIGSTIALGVLAQRLARERDRAEHEAARASSIAGFLQDTLSSADPWSGGNREVSVVEALKTATAKVDHAFHNQPLIAADVRRTIATTYSGLGRLDEAATLARSALDMQTTALGERNEDVAKTLGVLSNVYQDQGQYDQAEAAARQALAIRQGLPRVDEAAVAESLSRLARVLESRGQYKEAQARAEESLAIRRRVRGPRDEQVAESLGTLALVVANGASDLPRTEQLLGEQLDILRSIHGSDNVQVASVLNDLAVNHLRMEDYGRAESLYRESLAMNRRVLGDEHPQVAAGLENLGGVYYRTKRYQEALQALDEVLAMRRKMLGDRHVAVGRTLANIGTVRAAAKDYAGARASLTEADELLRAALGAEHPEIVTVSLNLGDALNRTGDRAAAERKFREAIAIALKTLPEDSPEMNRARSQLGNLLVSDRRFAEAEPLLLAAAAGRERKLGRDHRLTKAAAADVVTMYGAWNKPDKADSWRARAAP
jgi:serine/threonine protein kinase/tetratricopeptide (TPR) repeat protein